MNQVEICFPDITDKMDEIKTAESLQFDISTIRTATDHFSDASKLGEGGFGSVYKVTISLTCLYQFRSVYIYILVPNASRYHIRSLY